ncbi:hypothetical protein [uncultured Alsobacter sp.]|uniref:hypothetical protein n=1 Tax=uncultured Alsobacter sp. TaxID=1748258 RepID=UPI0025E777B1|nr:hypothetical protein [uncultured Alsobacter sp.]
MTTTLVPSRLLRLALLVDAAGSGATGLLFALGYGPLAGLTGLPRMLLLACGVFFVAYAAFVFWLGRHERPLAALVKLVVAGNLVWGLDSLLALWIGWLSPTGLGMALVVAQAAFVLVIAAVQGAGLRQSSPARLAAA